MENCIICGKGEDEVSLYDGIYVNEAVKICERCALINEIPIIKRPSSEQLRESEKPYSVRQRLSRLGGIQAEKTLNKPKQVEVLKQEKQIQAPTPKQMALKSNLVENYHWIIQTSRRRKCLTQKQLADLIHESETAIKFIEKNTPPEDSLQLIRKLEQFFNIKLFKKTPEEVIARETKQEISPRIDSSKIYADKMREKEGEEMVKEVILAEKEPRVLKHEEIGGVPMRALDFRKAKSENLSIAELKLIQKRIEEDFTKKSKEEVGQEQFNGFGKEDMIRLKSKVGLDNPRKDKSKKEVPSIYDLVKKKEEREKALTGKDIELEDSEF